MYRRQMIYAAIVLLFVGMIAGIIYAMFVPRVSVEQVRSAVAAHDEVHVYFKHDSASPALARRLLRLAAKEPVRR